MRPPLIEQLDLAMGDKSPAVRLACRCVLGAELKNLKQAGGWEGCGSYWSHRDNINPGERLRWAAYVMAVAGISDRSASFYFQCAQAVMTRLRVLKRPGWKALHRKMEMQPSTMTAGDRADMIQAIIMLGLCKGDTQTTLIREYRGVHLPALETDRETLGESGNEERGISAKELMDRYPDEKDLNTYTWAKTLRMDEETARLLVIVTKELRRRESLGIKNLES